MKKFFMAVAVFLMVAAILPAFVSAQEDETTSSDGDATVTQTNDVTAEARAAERQARIDQIKDRAEERVTAAEERRLAARCKAAQTIVDKLQSNMNTVLEKRRTAYGNAADKLTALVAQLQSASVDTTELEAAITQMNELAALFVAEIDTYNTTLSDIAGMECEADPAGFKAVLQSARDQRSELISQAGIFRSTINETLKPILQTIRDNLAAEETAPVSEE